MKKILVLALIAFILAFGVNSDVRSFNSPLPISDLLVRYCIDYVYTDTIVRECSETPHASLDERCREAMWFVNGKVRYTVTCNVYIAAPFNSPLPVVSPLPTPFVPYPEPFMSPPVMPETVPITVQDVTVSTEQEKPEYCFAFGFPCTDFNPAAPEGSICFCDAPMWQPN